MTHKIASTFVLKIGGNAMSPEAEASLAAQVAALRTAGHAVVVVHGGGPEIDAALSAAGKSSTRIGGLRATDRATLDIIERVLCGSLNKRIVRSLLQAGVAAVGLSGIDGMLLQGRRLDDPRLGFVGSIERVNPGPLRALLKARYVPVVAPLAYERESGGALNVNADTSAGAIAAALGADYLLLQTNVPRVRMDPRDSTSGIDAFDLPAARKFAASASCEGSMKPKIEAAIEAVAAGVTRALIGAAAISRMLDGDATVLSA